MTNDNAPSGPLVGVKVIDLCSFINGSYSAALMGDLGAEVIKIEPLTGDLARAWGPFFKGESQFYQASMLVVMAVNAALYHRERTGEGQMIETSLLQGVMSVHAHFYVEALECEEEGAFGIYPYRLFETSDDLIFIAAGTDKFWRMLCEELGVPGLGTDPRYDTNGKRAGRREELTEALQPIFRKQTSAEWEALLVAKGVPCASVKNYMEFFADPQVAAMEMNPVVEHPLIGRLRLIGVPVNFEKTPGSIQRAAPTLGEHTEEVLRELGYDDERIAKLRESMVI